MASCGSTRPINYQGNVALTTSYSTHNGDPDNIVNQVADTYNGFGLLTEEQQSVSGRGDHLDSRRLLLLLDRFLDAHPPDEHHVSQRPRLDLSATTRRGQAVGRVSYLADSDSTPLADYLYLGLDQIDEVSNPEPGVTLDLGTRTAMGNLTVSINSIRATDMVFAETGGNMTRSCTAMTFPATKLWQAQPTAASYGVLSRQALRLQRPE